MRPPPGSSTIRASFPPPRRLAATPFLVLLLPLLLLAALPAAALPPTYDLSFTGGPLTLDEGLIYNVNVTLVGGLCAPYSGVNWSTSAAGSGAMPAEPGNEDFMNPSPPMVGFSDGAGETISVQVQTLADPDADDETVTLTLTAASPTISCNGQLPTNTTYSIDFTIVDLAPQPTARIRSALGIGVSEGPASTTTPIVVSVELLNAPPAPYNYQVGITTFDQTATAASGDFVGTSAVVTFTNTSPGPHNFGFTVNGDNIPETSEGFLIKLFNPGPGIDIHLDHVVNVTINNDDATPHLSVADQPNHPEGSGGGLEQAHVQLTVTDAPIGVPMDIHWHTDNAGALTPATPGVDYNSVATIFTLTADASTEVFDLLVPVVKDGDPEPNESFFLIVDSVDFGTVLDDPQGEVTIVDDDVAPVTQLDITDNGPVAEGNSGSTLMSFTVTASGPLPPNGSTVQFHTEDDSAHGSEDYGITSGTLHFGPSLPTVQTIEVPILGDTVEEGVETFFVVIDNPVGMVIASGKAQGTINDDDSAQPPPQVSIAGLTLDEGDAGQATANFTVTLDAPSASPVTFSWKTVDGSATAASGDYLAVTSGNGFIPANTTQIQLPVRVNGDNQVEDDETFKVVLSEVAGGVFASSEATATIHNDDSPGEFSFSIGDVSVQEGDAGLVTATFTVTLSAAQGGIPTVEYSTDSDTATINSDFQPSAGQLVFAEGATSKTITVNVIGDTEPEADETFQVKLENPTGGATLADDTGVGTIVDDDAVAPQPPVLTIDDALTLEGNQGATQVAFVARLDHASDSPVTADYATFDGGATTADSDYQAKSGQLSFAPGVIEVAVTVLVIGDTKVEADETFGIALANAAGATVGRGQAQCVVRNDDAEVPPQDRSSIRLVRSDAAGEGAGFALVVVERSGEPVGAASARVTVSSGTATAGEDFTAVDEEVSWAAGVGGEREVRVPILADNRQEPDETARIAIGELRGAAAGQPLEGTLTILDDDSPMRLVVIGAAERDAETGNQIDLQVRAVREDGVPVAGAMVLFEAQSGPVRLLGAGEGQVEGQVRTDAEGLATQRVVVGPAPGTARVRARLAGSEAEASFVLRVAGNLGELGVGTGGDRNVGDILDQSCTTATGELARACAYLYGLTDPAERRQALAELTPQGVVAQLRAALQAPKNQSSNLGARLDALRGGGPLQTLDQLSMSIQGQSIGGVGTLQQSLLRGSVAASPRGGKTSPGIDQQIDRDAGWEGYRESDRDKVELALQRSRPGSLLARQDPASSDTDPRAGPTVDPYDSTESPWGMFVNGRMSFGDAPQRGTDPGYDFETDGLTVGIDYRVSSRFVVGAALGWVSSGSELPDGGGIDTEGWSLNLYGTWYRDKWYVEAVAGYGRNDYRFKRVIVLPQVFEGRDSFVTAGSPNSDQLSAELGAGYDFRLGEALSLTGFGRFSYVDTSIDEYSETGGGPFGLGFAGQDLKSLLGETGVEITYPWSVGWGVLQPILRLSYLHEFEDDPQVIRARFLLDGSQRFFVVRSERPDSDYLNLAAGISATLPRGWATFLQYDTDLERDELDIYTLSGGFRFQF